MTKLTLALVALIAINHAYAEEPVNLAAPAQPVAPAKEMASEKRGFVAALAGPALITSKGGGTHFSYGARLGFTLGKDSSAHGSLGLAVSSMTNSQTISGITVNGAFTFIGLEYVARHAWQTGLYFGARAGLGISSAEVSASATSLSASNTTFAYAPVIGYEIPLAGAANLIFDAAWVNRGGGTLKFGTESINYDSASVLNFQAGITLGF